MLTIAKLVEDNTEQLDLQWVAGIDHDKKFFFDQNINFAADLIGHLNAIHPGRIQVIGQQEYHYYVHFNTRQRQRIFREMLASNMPAVIVADNISPPEDLINKCQEHHIPLLTSPYSASEIIDILRVYLSKKLAPTITMHGVFMDVLGMGVLISGKSGLGKSELALELISRGHGLVADDAVDFSKITPSIIEGRCPPLLQNLIEVRGLGLLDIKAIFGESAVRRRMSLKLIVHLERQSNHTHEYERLPLQALHETVLDLHIPKVILPVAAGRNLAVLVEAAVRNTILKLRGIDTLSEFMERQSKAMRNESS